MSASVSTSRVGGCPAAFHAVLSPPGCHYKCNLRSPGVLQLKLYLMEELITPSSVEERGGDGDGDGGGDGGGGGGGDGDGSGGDGGDGVYDGGDGNSGDDEG